MIIILPIKLMRISVFDTLSFTKMIYALTEVLKNLHTHCEGNICHFLFDSGPIKVFNLICAMSFYDKNITIHSNKCLNNTL